jgi:RecB family exonuclease
MTAELVRRPYESPSSLQRYQKCPYSYWLRYISGTKERPEQGQPARFGTFVHAVLARLFDFVIQAQFKGELDDRYIRAKANEVANEQGFGVIQASECYALIKAYLTRHGPLDWRHHLSNEKEYNFDMPGVGMVKVVLDRIDKVGDDTVSVVDYKSGKDWNDYHIQGILYTYAAKHMFDWAIHSNFSIEFLKLGTRKEFNHSAGQLAAEVERIQGIKARINAGMFGPVIGFHCKWCDMRNACKYFQSSKKG